MKFRFFKVSALDPDDAQEALNRFCSSHALISLDKQFVSWGQESYWAFCIQYSDGTARVIPTKKEKIDYREVLSETDFAIYSKLRVLRKELSDREGVPLYSIFTNEQMAKIVERRISTKAGLMGIAGVGRARADKYAEAFLALLSAELRREETGEENAN
jgi:superfamily II DNA helicase RecQ